MGDAPLSDGKWEDCGCPQSLSYRENYRADFTCGPHQCLVSRDEFRKHYICDRHAYVRAIKAPEGSILGQWIAQRLPEGRMFVAKPPERPPLPPEPWRFDEPPLLSGPLQKGWRYWEPVDEAFTFGGYTTSETYDTMLDEFFELIGLDLVTKKLMMESGEAWILTCGNPHRSIKVYNRQPLKNDRVFVTADNEFFAVMMHVVQTPNMQKMLAKWLGVLGVGIKMKHTRRLLDIRMDAKIWMGGCGHVFSYI